MTLLIYQISQEPGFILENQGSVRKQQKGHILRLELSLERAHIGLDFLHF